MAVTKRIMISLPESLLAEVDCFVREQKCNRSEVIRDAMKFYLQQQKHQHLREILRRGYIEMAQTNLTLSEESLLLENEAMDRVPGRKASGVS